MKGAFEVKLKTFFLASQVLSNNIMYEKCLTNNIMYKATLTSVQDTSKYKIYYGITETKFKQRNANHVKSLRHETYQSNTELSN